MRTRLWCFLIFLGMWACPCAASDWARDMFEEASHDFGTVAAGSKAEFTFTFRNLYVGDLHISRAYSSCGCTRVKFEDKLLKTYETGEIVASINSDAFRGQRSATIHVVFDQPRYGRVQLGVRVNIRGDVVLEPSGIVFSGVNRGVPAERSVKVTRYGGANWRILEATPSAAYLTAALTETERNGSRVSYEVRVSLAEDAPAGYLHEEILLTTNDESGTKIPIMVEGRVVPEITVAPATLFFGTIDPHQSVAKRLIVRGKQPFRIMSVDAGDESFEFDTANADQPKKLHFVPVKFTSGDHPGAVARRIRIETDLYGEHHDVIAYVHVVAPKDGPAAAE